MELRLPSEYQEVEYIENTGTQYIITDLLFPKELENPKIEWGFMQIAVPSGDNMVFGYWSNGSIYYEVYNSTALSYASIGKNHYDRISNANLTKDIVIAGVMTKETMYLNGYSYATNAEDTIDQSIRPMAIFAWNSSSGRTYTNKGARIYYLRFFDGNTKMADYVPCYRKSDGEIGMYDTVTKTFYTNSGTDTFLKGADITRYIDNVSVLDTRRKILLNTPHIDTSVGDLVTFNTDLSAPLKSCKVSFLPVQEGEGDPSPDNVRNIVGWNEVKVGLPDEYQKVEYIESTGTQYIDTGVTLGTNDFTILFNFEQTKRTSGEQPITSIWTSDYNYWNLFIRSVSSDKIVLDVYTSAHHMLSTEVNLNEKYDVSLIKNDNLWELKQKDSTITWTYSSSKINNTTLKLFKRGDLSTGHSTHIKMYSFKMTISNTRTLNLIPCYRKSDGEIGMYDTVSKQFFTNQGTDTFLKGADVDGIQASIDWTNDVGTVYGGYVDLVSGELVVTHKYASLNDPTKWSAFSGYETTIFVYNDSFFDRKIFDTTTMGFICSFVSTNNTANYWGRWASKKSDTFWIRNNDSVDSDLWISLEEIKQNASDGNIFICYELATPIHYQLTPQQLSTLKGTNNVYSDTNGQTEIKYWKH